MYMRFVFSEYDDHVDTQNIRKKTRPSRNRCSTSRNQPKTDRRRKASGQEENWRYHDDNYRIAFAEKNLGETHDDNYTINNQNIRATMAPHKTDVGGRNLHKQIAIAPMIPVPKTLD